MLKFKTYIVSADKEALKEFIYEELLNHTSSPIAQKYDTIDGTYGLLIHVTDHYEPFFIQACAAYGIKIMWHATEFSEEEAA